MNQRSEEKGLSRGALSETALITALNRLFGPAPPEVLLGIGDDCAAIRLDEDRCLLLTVDTLVEGVHFDLSYTPLQKLGFKALAVNLSDIAAMGGEPRYALLSLGWPPSRDRAGALVLAEGLARAAREYGVSLIGGDTVASPGGLSLTVTLTGEVAAARMLRRSGAQAGDLVYVTGPLGEAAAGLEVLRRGLQLAPEAQRALTEAFLTPRPQLKAGRLLAATGLATALIDLSDGVATDLFHICQASSVGAVIEAGLVPVSPHLAAAAPALGLDPLSLALSGGEDYQLLFTSPREAAPALKQAFSQAGLPPPRALGEIQAGQKVLLARGLEKIDISGQGYDHFRLAFEPEDT
jgi:thiamine-monophosphate kinase